jgi:acetyl-CoA carboxylase biotin carboxylase subunit
MIKKILIANRGEIAIRVMRTCREMGIKSVAVYSDIDRNAMHVRYADEAYHIGPSPSAQSYLVIDKIFEAVKKSGADAIHPGYGFLSENAIFEERCRQEGIIFIGPSAEAISTMGDKITSRRKMIEAGVPVVPGTTDPITSEEEAIKTIYEIGLPVMIKASAGGGGKGMRMVDKEEDIISSLRAARSEAKASFANDAVYIEKYIESPHHIEFQVLGDTHGNVIHLFERECSVQRRHQKVVEESPSPLLTPEVREKMGATAVAAAKAVNYAGAGTIEFIMDNDLNYYFLEMNTRLQVEHPITEYVTGVDLVKEQIRVASGLELSYKQEELSQRGHSIECRIYAEDPDNNFMPSPGKIKHLSEPSGPGIRIDGYAYQGYTIPMDYDPMISKLIVWGDDREAALQRMHRALNEYKIAGVKTSIALLDKIIGHPDFVSGNYNTHFIEKNHDELFAKDEQENNNEIFALLTALIDYDNHIEESKKKIVNHAPENNWRACGIRRARRSF